MAKDIKIGRTPNDWEILKLGDSCEFKRGQPFAKSEIIKDGKKECIHYGELFTVYSEIIRKVYSKTDSDVIRASKIGDILMPSSDVTPTGLATSSVINDEGVLIGGDINIIRPIKNLNSNYLSYLINYEKKKIIRLISGTNIKHIYNRDLKTLQYAVPPLYEQQKIAEILSTVDETIEKTNAIIEETRQLKKGLMQKLFTEGIGHTNFRDNKIGQINCGEIPNSWKELDLDSICNVTSSKRIMMHEYVDSGIPFYRSKEIIEKTKNKRHKKIHYINETKYQELKTKFGAPQKGDILITAVGSLGIPYLIMNDEEFYFKDGNLIWLRDIDMKINKRFLIYYFESYGFMKFIEIITGGSSQKALTIEKLGKLRIAIPNSSEQQKISIILSEVDAKIEKEEATKIELEQLKKGLMQVLLTGKVRVKA